MSVMNKINYVKELNVIGCALPDIYVTVETGFQAGVPALLSLLTPGCTDIVKMKLGRSPWHRKSIRSLIKGARAPFSIQANKFLYKVGYDTAERGLYWFMVADVTAEFFITWQSLAFVAEQCPLPNAGTAYGYMTPFIYGEDQETLLTPTPLHNATGMATGLHGWTIFPGFQGEVAWTAEWDSWPERGKGVSVTTWMTEDDLTIPISTSTTNQPPSQPYNETVGHTSFDTTRMFTGKSYTLHVHNTGDTKAQIIAGGYSINMRGHPTGVLPWGCKFKKTTNPFF